MMLTLVSQWQESGMTQVKFARENNVSVHTLKYWLYKKKEIRGYSGRIHSAAGIFTGK
jgi:DNA-binding transcriptional regulator YiaG